MASWFTDTILPEVRSFGSGFKDRVREQASRAALALRETAGTGETSKQRQLVAQDAHARIEAEAMRLSQPQQATEVLERWLSSFQTAERRYIEKEDGERTCPRELSFRQVFLRSRALELAVDSCTRAPGLRNSLRNHALPPPESWPQYCSHSVAFARAFVALLLACIGPPEVWLSLLGTLLSQEQVPSAHAGDAEEPCHMWLVQLLASRRLGWEAAGLSEREAEVQELEETATRSLESLSDDSTEQGSSTSLAELLAELASRNTAMAAVERAWERRCVLGAELSRAAAGEASRRDDVCNCAASVAAAAQSLASSMAGSDEGADEGHEASVAIRGELGAKSKDLRERLQQLCADAEELHVEMQAAEGRQKDLLKQLQDNKEHLENLKRLRAENRKEAESLQHSAQRAEGKLAKRLADEDKATERAQASIALVDAVANIATSMTDGAQQAESEDCDNSQARLKLAAEQSQLRAGRSGLELAAQEVRHLRLATEVATAAIATAEAEPDAEDLESALLRPALAELQRCCGKQTLAETLAIFLEVQDDQISQDDSQELPDSGAPCKGKAAELRRSLEACREKLDILEALLPAATLTLASEPEPDGGPWEVVDECSHAEISTVDAFLRHPATGSSQAPGAQEKSVGGGVGSFRGLFGLAWSKAAAPGRGGLPPDDPFLLEGTEAAEARPSEGSEESTTNPRRTESSAVDCRAGGSFI